MEHNDVDLVLRTFIINVPSLNPGSHKECTE